MPSEMRSFSTSTPSTTASTSSPFLKSSEGCFTFFVQWRSETCTRPSIPSSTPTKIPKSVMLFTLPLIRGADRVVDLHQLPGIRLGLLEAERDPPVRRVDVEDLHLDLLPLASDLARMRSRAFHDISET